MIVGSLRFACTVLVREVVQQRSQAFHAIRRFFGGRGLETVACWLTPRGYEPSGSGLGCKPAWVPDGRIWTVWMQTGEILASNRA